MTGGAVTDADDVFTDGPMAKLAVECGNAGDGGGGDLGDPGQPFQYSISEQHQPHDSDSEGRKTG